MEFENIPMQLKAKSLCAERPSFSLNKYDPSSPSIPLSVECRTPVSVNEIFIRILNNIDSIQKYEKIKIKS